MAALKLFLLLTLGTGRAVSQSSPTAYPMKVIPEGLLLSSLLSGADQRGARAELSSNSAVTSDGPSAYINSAAVGSAAAKIAATAPAPIHHHAAAPAKADTADAGDTAPADATPQKGYEYPVQANDTLSAIARAYREKGVKVTVAQIEKANPGLTASTLYVGKTIFIPDPNAK